MTLAVCRRGLSAPAHTVKAYINCELKEQHDAAHWLLRVAGPPQHAFGLGRQGVARFALYLLPQ
jgi:hypothetical protein